MKLVYFKDKHGNFGDHLNSWMWEQLAPGIWHDDDEVAMCALGTILENWMPKMRSCIVFSSGTGYSSPPAGFGGPNWTVVSVRGPLTAKVLNLPPDAAVTDGAILLAALPHGLGQPVPESERHGIVFMPYYKQLRFGRWPQACAAAGIEFLSPYGDSRKTLERLRHAKLVLADAMHGAICADTMRVPWVPLCISSEINSFKWLDWTQSMGLPYKPHSLPYSSLLERLQSRSFVISGTANALDDLGVEAALAHYHAKIRRRKDFWVWNSRRAINASIIALRGLSRLPVLSSVHGRFDRIQFDKAVEALKQIKDAPTYLSNDAIFATRRAEMLSRFEQVKQLARTGLARTGKLQAADAAA